MGRVADDALDNLRELYDAALEIAGTETTTGHGQLLTRLAKAIDLMDKYMCEGREIPHEWGRGMRERPRYIHDCEDCVFLGRWANFDLYFCERADGGTALARYGDDGPEYSSMMVDYARLHAEKKLELNNISATRVAALIAEDAGLLKRKLKEPHAKGFRIIDRRTLQASEVIESSRHAYREACKDCPPASIVDCEHNCPREVVVIISGGTNG